MEAANQTLADEITDFVFQGIYPQFYPLNQKGKLDLPPKSNPIFLAAVPKQLQQQLLPPSSQIISPGGIVTQTIRVNNPQKLQLKMKLRITYKLNGNQINTDGVVSNFPAAAWQ